jgi:hypothetical protein
VATGLAYNYGLYGPLQLSPFLQQFQPDHYQPESKPTTPLTFKSGPVETIPLPHPVNMSTVDKPYVELIYDEIKKLYGQSVSISAE